MRASNVLLAGLSFSFVIVLSQHALGQSWNETAHHYHGKHYHTNEVMYTWTGTGARMTVNATIPAWFIVSGSTSTAPTWRSPFAVLRNDNLTVSETFSDFVASGWLLRNLANTYWRGPHSNDWCTNSAHEADCGKGSNHNTFSNGSDFVSRSLREKVCESLWFDLTPGGGGT